MKKAFLGIIAVFSVAMLNFVSCSSEDDSHEHTFATTYTTNETYHWYAATCEHKDEVKDKVEHSFGEWSITKYSTEETEGKKERECEVCHYKVEETVAKLNHTHAKGTYHEAVAGTCQTKGTVEYYDCVKETCEEKLDAEGNPLSSIEGGYGHALGTKNEAVEGTCVTKSTIEYYDCVNEDCTKKLDKDLNVLALIEGELNPANHTGTATTWTKVAWFHKETYDCCGAEKVELRYHTFGEYVSNNDATWKDNGTKTRICSVCSYEDTVIDAWTRTDIFCEKPYDVETNEVATASSKYIYFGVFPKTVRFSSSVTVDETEMKVMGANTYYKGNDGNYYAKVEENACGMGTEYSDGTRANVSSANSYRYFKVEPIKWKVLTTNYNNTNKALLLCEDILTGNVPYYKCNSYSNKRTVGSDTNIYPNNYKYSQIRAYLNGLDYYYDTDSTTTTKKTEYTEKGFVQTAFTSTAQSLIAETEVDNSVESTGDSTNNYVCENTNDKVFLLSYKEVVNSDYGFNSNNTRIRVTTDYAKANYASQITISGEGGWWWLRSPNYNDNSCSVYDVECGGRADLPSVVDYNNFGVVPALCISLE